MSDESESARPQLIVQRHERMCLRDAVGDRVERGESRASGFRLAALESVELFRRSALEVAEPELRSCATGDRPTEVDLCVRDVRRHREEKHEERRDQRTSGTACPRAGHRDQCEEGRPEYQKGPGEHERRSEQTRTGATPHAWPAAQAGESNGRSRE